MKMLTALTVLLTLAFMTPPITPVEADGVRRHHRSAKHRKPKAPAVAAWHDRDGWRDHKKCWPDRVRGLGTQWIGTQGATDAAKKDWMERVRYDLGESYLDLSHAEDFEARCGRVSVGEVAGQVMYRCEVMARPCKATFDKVEGQK